MRIEYYMQINRNQLTNFNFMFPIISNKLIRYDLKRCIHLYKFMFVICYFNFILMTISIGNSILVISNNGQDNFILTHLVRLNKNVYLQYR